MRFRFSAVAASVVACCLTLAGEAGAESIIKNPGDHPKYSVELEPHVLLGWADLYRDNGLGVGMRLTIPIVDNGFIKSINNNVDTCWKAQHMLPGAP